MPEGSSTPLYTDLPITIVVHEIDEEPEALPPAEPFLFDEDTVQTIDLAELFSDAEEDAGDLTYSVIYSEDETVVPLTGLSIDSAGVLSITPAADKFGYSTITVRATDSGGNSTDLDLFTIIEPVDDAPRVLGAANRPLSIGQQQLANPTLVNLDEYFFDPEWGSYLDYVVTASRPEMFVMDAGGNWPVYDGKLLVNPSGIAGSSSVTIEAKDSQTGLPAAVRTIDVTIDALPYVWFENVKDGFVGGPSAQFTLRRNGGRVDLPLDVVVNSYPAYGQSTTFTIPANQATYTHEIPVLADSDPPPPSSPSVFRDGFRLSVGASANYHVGENLPDVYMTYPESAWINNYDDEVGLNRVWLESASGSTDLEVGEYVDLTYKRSGNLNQDTAFKIESRSIEGTNLHVGFSYANGDPLQYNANAWFASGQDSVTVRVSTFDTAGSQLDVPTKTLIRISPETNSVIQSNSQTTVTITDDDLSPAAVDLVLGGLNESLEESLGLVLGVNNGVTDGSTAQVDETQPYQGNDYEVAVDRVVANNELDRNRAQRVKLHPGWGTPENSTLGHVGWHNPSAYSFPGTLTWNIPEGLQVWRKQLVGPTWLGATVWLPVADGEQLPFRIGAQIDIAVEGIAPESAPLSVSFLPDDEDAGIASSADRVLVHAVQIELFADSNRDGEISTTLGGADDAVEDKSPGVALNLQYDDDDHNGTFDNQQTTYTADEDDLVEMKLQLLPANPSAELLQALNGYRVYLGSGAGASLRFWRDANKSESFDNRSWTIGTDTLPASTWVEALTRGEGAAKAFLSLPGIYNSPISEDRVNVEVDHSVFMILDLDGSEFLAEDPTDFLGLTQEEWAQFETARDEWLDEMGEPLLPHHLVTETNIATLLSTLNDFVIHTESERSLVESAIFELNILESDASTPHELYVQKLQQVIQWHDEYLYALRLVWKLEGHIESQWTDVNWGNLKQRIMVLPARIDGVPGALRPEQWDGLRDDLQEVGRQMKDNVRTLEWLSGAWEGTGNTLKWGGTLGAVGVALPPVGLVLFAYGMFYIAQNTGESIALRHDIEDHSFLDASIGVAYDVTGYTKYRVGLNSFDPTSGKRIDLTDYERGLQFGAGLGGMTLTVVTVGFATRLPLKPDWMKFNIPPLKNWPIVEQQATRLIQGTLPTQEQLAGLRPLANIAPTARMYLAEMWTGTTKFIVALVARGPVDEIAEVGQITLGPLDTLSRPTGVVATLTADMINAGSRANQAIIPPGFLGGAAGHVRGHLLARLLGGTGDDARNLVTMWRNANSPIMRDFERRVADVVLGGERVRLKVTPKYNGNDLVPEGISMEAVGSRGFELRVTVLNIE